MTYGFDQFIAEAEYIVPRSRNQHELVQQLLPSMQKLLNNELLLPGDFIQALVHNQTDGRIYTSPQNGFFVQVFAWTPGSSTPVHDHNTWGIMGVFHNKLQITEFAVQSTAEPGVFHLHPKGKHLAGPGMIATITSPDDEIHHVENPTDSYSFSIHVYGAELDGTHVFDFDTGRFTRS